MSNLESKISELERELALKKGYQAVKFVLPKNLPDDVATEIQSKLREIAESMALKKEQLASDDTPTTAASVFTEEETKALKMIAETVIKKTNGSPTPASNGTVNGGPAVVSTQGNHVPKNVGISRKAKVMTAENVRGEGRRFIAPEDELFIGNPDKVDDHGMVSATHMKRGVMVKIPIDDIEFLD